MAYDDIQSAFEMTIAVEGSLELSLFSNDPDVQSQAMVTLGTWHDRILCVDEDVGETHTRHVKKMPQCIHGWPGRVGGGEELYGLRGMRPHMQQTTVQGDGRLLDQFASFAPTATP